MNLIYEPKGAAREYGALAVNPYIGCNIGCQYCYAPGIMRQTREDYQKPRLRENFIEQFSREAVKYRGSKKALFFSFLSDPYNSEEMKNGVMREALQICYKNKIPVQILTKSTDVHWDIDLFKMFGQHIAVGMTLTFSNVEESERWEPGAATPLERIDILNILKAEGVPTWASIEPIIDPQQTFYMICQSENVVGFYKIGKLNNYQGIDKKINWHNFLNTVTTYLRSNKKSFYIKKALQKAASSVKLIDEEISPDLFGPVPWED